MEKRVSTTLSTPPSGNVIGIIWFVIILVLVYVLFQTAPGGTQKDTYIFGITAFVIIFCMSYPIFTRDMILPAERTRANIISFVVCLIATIAVGFRNMRFVYFYVPLMIWLTYVVTFLTDRCDLFGRSSETLLHRHHRSQTDHSDRNAIKMVLNM